MIFGGHVFRAIRVGLLWLNSGTLLWIPVALGLGLWCIHRVPETALGQRWEFSCHVGPWLLRLVGTSREPEEE